MFNSVEGCAVIYWLLVSMLDCQSRGGGSNPGRGIFLDFYSNCASSLARMSTPTLHCQW